MSASLPACVCGRTFIVVNNIDDTTEVLLPKYRPFHYNYRQFKLTITETISLFYVSTTYRPFHLNGSFMRVPIDIYGGDDSSTTERYSSLSIEFMCL